MGLFKNIFGLGDSNIDPGWDALQQSKVLWQRIPHLTPHLWYGKMNPFASQYRSDPQIVTARELIEKAIYDSPLSNNDPVRAKVNGAVALQELGLLYRALNEFQGAREAYTRSLEIFEELGGVAASESRVLVGYRETLFRIAELEHTSGNSDEARKYYAKSLEIDDLLNHNDPTGEKITRQLLDNLS